VPGKEKRRNEAFMQDIITAWQEEAVTTLDVRQDLERGDEPFVRIMTVAQQVGAGQTFVLIAPFEPAPLYEVLGGQGFTHETLSLAPDAWYVRFQRSAAGG
jgi:uncharacterized protein (DUF2249 family)